MNSTLYESLHLELSDASLQMLIWCICAGVMLGIVLTILRRAQASAVIAALREHGADTPETAQTLEELGLGKRILLRRYLKTGSAMRRLVLCANEEEFPEEKPHPLAVFWYEKFLRDEIPTRVPFGVARFYLPEENRVKAEFRYPKESHPVRTCILSAVLLGLAAVFVTWALPQLLTMLENFINDIKPELY